MGVGLENGMGGGADGSGGGVGGDESEGKNGWWSVRRLWVAVVVERKRNKSKSILIFLGIFLSV